MPYNTWSADATASQAGSVNSSLDGLSVAEGTMPAGNVNAALRMLMANIRQLYETVVDGSALSAFMPKAGGVFSGDITRNTRGAYLHHASASNLSGRVFVTSSGAADPTSQVGDIWIELT